jgi:hypothetical protein
MSEVKRHNLGLPEEIDDYVIDLSNRDGVSKNSVIVSCIKRQKIINDHIEGGGTLVFKNPDGTEINVIFV